MQRAARRSGHVERRGDGARDEDVVLHGGKVDEGGTVRERGLELMRQRQRESRLAGAAGTAERQQSDIVAA